MTRPECAILLPLLLAGAQASALSRPIGADSLVLEPCPALEASAPAQLRATASGLQQLEKAGMMPTPTSELRVFLYPGRGGERIITLEVLKPLQETDLTFYTAQNRLFEWPARRGGKRLKARRKTPSIDRTKVQVSGSLVQALIEPVRAALQLLEYPSESRIFFHTPVLAFVWFDEGGAPRCGQYRMAGVTRPGEVQRWLEVLGWPDLDSQARSSAVDRLERSLATHSSG